MSPSEPVRLAALGLPSRSIRRQKYRCDLLRRRNTSTGDDTEVFGILESSIHQPSADIRSQEAVCSQHRLEGSRSVLWHFG